MKRYLPDMAAKDWVRIGLAALIVVMVGSWLWLVGSRLGVPPEYTEDGKLIIDQYARAKDILVAVLPLATTVLGYYFGAAGKDKAEESAQKAQEEANSARQQVSEARGVVAGLSAGVDSSVLQTVRARYPQFFD